MLKQILYKWFGLSDPPCETCDVLRERLAYSEKERVMMLQKLLEKGTEPPVTPTERVEPEAIRPQFVPWRVRQQMLEAEDRKAAQLKRDKAREIADLEKELGVTHQSAAAGGRVATSSGE